MKSGAQTDEIEQHIFFPEISMCAYSHLEGEWMSAQAFSLLILASERADPRGWRLLSAPFTPKGRTVVVLRASLLMDILIPQCHFFRFLLIHSAKMQSDAMPGWCQPPELGIRQATARKHIHPLI